MYFKVIPVSERLPELYKFVVTIDEKGEMAIYRLTEIGWNMRDGMATNSPDNNFQIISWLEPCSEKDFEVQESKAKKWDELGSKIDECYDEENNRDENIDLTTIGEIAAQSYGYL